MIKAYLWAFVNFEYYNWVRLLLISEFTYNNTMNAKTGHIFFELNCGYLLCVFYKKDLNIRLKLKVVKELSSKL